MAFNPYFQPAYQPVWNPYQQNYQPQQMIQPQQTPAQVGNVWITDESEVAGYPVAPNNAVRLWSAKDSVFYLKSADATGKPSIKIFDVVERIQGGSEPSSGQDVKTIDYVSKDELSRISAVLESIRGDIETMKVDLYGVAGRKKKEVNDDE